MKRVTMHRHFRFSERNRNWLLHFFAGVRKIEKALAKYAVRQRINSNGWVPEWLKGAVCKIAG